MSLSPASLFVSFVLMLVHVLYVGIVDDKFMFFFYGSKSVEYSEKTMEEALKKVEKMDADLGGTEILEPLQHIHSQSCIPKHPRQVTHTHTHTQEKLCCLCKWSSTNQSCWYFGSNWVCSRQI